LSQLCSRLRRRDGDAGAHHHHPVARRVGALDETRGDAAPPQVRSLLWRTWMAAWRAIESGWPPKQSASHGPRPLDGICCGLTGPGTDDVSRVDRVRDAMVRMGDCFVPPLRLSPRLAWRWRTRAGRSDQTA